MTESPPVMNLNSTLHTTHRASNFLLSLAAVFALASSLRNTRYAADGSTRSQYGCD